MSRKLRIFVSSTMVDLVNERRSVCNKLIDFNFEPVNAEGLLPNGHSSWDKIAKEIRSCDIFILIIGEKYGWVPKRGPESEKGLSVTHLEFIEAQSLGIPILPFIKELSYDTVRRSNDAKKRDLFRKAVMDWDGGRFISKFSLAEDLGQRVGRSVISLLTEEFQEIKQRATAVTVNASKLIDDSVSSVPIFNIPSELVTKIKNKDVVLFAGSGVSLSTGIPSASAFSEKLAQVIIESNSDYYINNVGSVFAGIATDLEILKGRRQLIDAVCSLIRTPHGSEPSIAHLNAVKAFDQIITTNYDTHFEEAARIQGISLQLINNEISESCLPPNKTLIKVHGSYESPDSLLLTEQDILLMDKTRKNLWNALINLLTSKTVLVIGTSLRDPSIIRLFTEAGAISGYFITPQIYGYTQDLAKRWNLRCLKADANSFFKSIAEIENI